MHHQGNNNYVEGWLWQGGEGYAEEGEEREIVMCVCVSVHVCVCERACLCVHRAFR